MSAPVTPDRLSDIFGAMNEETPSAAPMYSSPLVRPRSSSDAEDGPEQPPRFTLSTQNLKTAVQRYATSKRLRQDQTAEAVARLHDSQALRDAKLFVDIKVLENKVDAIVTAQPPYQVSEVLEKNIAKYAVAIFLSPKLVAYKGMVPVNTLLELLLKHRFDIPVGIQNNPADLDTLKRAIQEAFTQLRSKIKKALGASVQFDKKERSIGPLYQHHQNIYALAQVLVENSNCAVTVELCARVALMRDIFIQYHDREINFWNKVDAYLVNIREQARGDAKMIARGFRSILQRDRTTHGTNNYDISDDAGAPMQQEVADVIDANTMNVASSVPEPAASASEPVGGDEA